MKKWLWLFLGVAVILFGFYESRYSSDMQGHIDQVNHDLFEASLHSTYSTGLIGALDAMRERTEVANEIIDTHEHVHTLRDELLARKIKEAAADGVTVGGAIQNVIEVWPSSI